MSGRRGGISARAVRSQTARDRRRARALALLSVAAPAVAAGALVAYAATPGVEAVPSAQATGSAPPATPAVPTTAVRLRPLRAAAGRAGVGSRTLESMAGGIRPGAPARLRIRAAGVDAPIVHLGARGGELALPPAARPGWFAGGPRPGEPGRAVIAGHLDSRQGAGVFWRVPTLAPGQAIEVIDDGGLVHRFRVTGRAQVAKARFPAGAVYGPAARPALVLITCGGPFEPGAGYRDNVLVVARAA